MKFFNCLFFLIGIISTTNNFAQENSPKIHLEDEKKTADSLVISGDYDKAILKYESIIGSDSAYKESVREYLIKSYAYLGMFATAEERTQELYQNYGDDNDASIGFYCRYSFIYAMQNKKDKAMDVVDEMMKFAVPGEYFPGAPACAMYFETPAGRYEEALEKIYPIIDQAPRDFKLIFTMYAAYLERKLGNEEKSKELIQMVGAGVKAMKKSGELQKVINSQGGHVIYRYLAAFHSLNNERDKVIENLKRNYEEGGRQYYWIRNVSPFFEEYQNDPEFLSIMEAMKDQIDKMRSNLESKLALK